MVDHPRWQHDAGWTPSEPEPDPRQSGLRAARGVMYALAISAAMVLAVLAIMWWAL